MIELQSDKLNVYLPLEDKHLTINKDITEENRLDQRNDIMPWFWMIKTGMENNKESTNTWMHECESITSSFLPTKIECII